MHFRLLQQKQLGAIITQQFGYKRKNLADPISNIY